MKKMIIPIVLAALMILSPLTIMAETKEPAKEEYRHVIGKIVNITKKDITSAKRLADVKKLTEGEISIRIEYGEEDDEGEVAKADFVIDVNTYLPKGADFEVGDTFIGFYQTNQPMVLIYPPRYPAVVASVLDEEDVTPIVAVFDENMLAVDNSLKINSTEGTEILDINGKKFEGDLVGHTLYVEYKISTMSIPPQTTPEKIVVLKENTEDTNGKDPVEVDSDYLSTVDFSTVKYAIGGEFIEAPEAYVSDDVLMVPLRAIAEALDLDVVWDSDTQGIRVGLDATLKIGEDYYTFARMAPFTLGKAPELVNGITYVPMNYFSDVLHFNNAYFFEGQIVVNNDEVME